MAFDISAFRAGFPEFSDTSRYPDAQINFWADLAVAQVNECVWKTQVVKGQQLYVAHEITLAARNAAVVANGGFPGDNYGPTSSKAVGGVNVSYDANQTAEKDAGYWNLTTYGKQFIRLARIFGAGAIQLGVGFSYSEYGRFY